MAADRLDSRACNGTVYEQDGGRMNDNVSHPAHYQGKHECIDLMTAMYGEYEVMCFCKLNAFKYRFRAGKKPGSPFEEDIKKAEFYEDKYMELWKKMKEKYE